jgi:hypothetical protein
VNNIGRTLFLWWLDGEQQIDELTLQKHLTAYYEGLVNRNIVGRNIPDAKVVNTKVTIKKLKTDDKYLGNYSGTIHMLDYMAQKLIILNCLVQVKSCKSENHTMVFFELSPKPYSHPVWNEMERIKVHMECVD